MKLDQTKGVIDDHEDNFAIVFAAMGVSCMTLAPSPPPQHTHTQSNSSLPLFSLVGEYGDCSFL